MKYAEKSMHFYQVKNAHYHNERDIQLCGRYILPHLYLIVNTLYQKRSKIAQKVGAVILLKGDKISREAARGALLSPGVQDPRHPRNARIERL